MKLAVAALTVALAGCAAQPQQTVVNLDTRSSKYSSEECRMARQTALSYDDNVGARVGGGLALGLLLGPFGIPLAMAMDSAQNDKRQAINTELVKHCGATTQGAYKAPGPMGNPNSTACAQGAAPC